MLVLLVGVVDRESELEIFYGSFVSYLRVVAGGCELL